MASVADSVWPGPAGARTGGGSAQAPTLPSPNDPPQKTQEAPPGTGVAPTHLRERRDSVYRLTPGPRWGAPSAENAPSLLREDVSFAHVTPTQPRHRPSSNRRPAVPEPSRSSSRKPRSGEGVGAEGDAPAPTIPGRHRPPPQAAGIGSRVPTSAPRAHTRTHRLTLARTHSHPRADPARGPAPAPAGAPSGARGPRTQPASAGGRRRLRADLIFPQPGRPGAPAGAEAEALAAGSPAPLPPAPRPSERRRSPGAPRVPAPPPPAPDPAPHPRPLSLAFTPSVPTRGRTVLSPNPSPRLRASLPVPSPRAPPPLSAAPQLAGHRAPLCWHPRPPRRVTCTPSSVPGPRSLRPPSLSHFPRPLLALLSPPFAAQRRLRSWGRAQGFSRFGGGVNRAGTD